jgi:hypothetical protein
MSLWILIYRKKNKSLYFFQCFLESLCPFKNKLNICVFLISYTCLHVISYKCKYVLFHLITLKLFEDINMFFFLEIKLISNKNLSLKYLIQGFNPHLLNQFNVYPPYCFQNFNELKTWLVD